MATTTTPTSNYVEEFLPPSIVEKLESGAWKSLCDHLRDRSDEVQNIDLMTISGFCRNCLAKWMVIEARKLSDNLRQNDKNKNATSDAAELESILKSLDALGYDEAAQYVYGMDYKDWKKAHAKKATDDQMEKFNDSKPVWAKHDKEALAKRTDAPGKKMVGSSAIKLPSSSTLSGAVPSSSTSSSSPSLLSNVCCQDVEVSVAEPVAAAAPPKKKSNTRELPPFKSPTPPPVSFTLGILTISDRASSGEYETGDLSGPAVLDAVQRAVASYGQSSAGGVSLASSESSIVPDDMTAIESKLKEWADDKSQLDLILTTGGTGFSPRDVTPEATENVVDRQCPGLVSFCTMECSKLQPLASLSRGTAGVRGTTLIANLPGNPKGVQEIIPILLPLALHAVSDMKKV